MQNIIDYVYPLLDTKDFQEKNEIGKLKMFDEKLLNFLNKDMYVKRDDFCTVLIDYIYLFDDNYEFFKNLLLVTLDVMGKILKTDVYCVYDDTLEYDEYEIVFCKESFDGDQRIEFVTNSYFNVYAILLKVLLEKEEYISKLLDLIKNEEKNKKRLLKLS